LKSDRIYLSPPHQSGNELEAFRQVLDSNWLAPVGPDLIRFEQEICKATGFKYAVATSSGTAALHLGLKVLGVGNGHDVLTSTLTFVGAVNPIIYQGASPIFVDSDNDSWNIDASLIEEYLIQSNKKVKAILPTHLYGMPADVLKLEEISRKFDVPVLHDMAECLAGKVNGKRIGACAQRGVLSFNGNKLITTSGGGAFVTNHKEEAERVLYLATQAKSNTMGYHHESIGYNYRMSNVLAALGVEQINTLKERLESKKRIFNTYKSAFSTLGCEFQKEPKGIESDHWLTCILFEPELKMDLEEVVRQMNEQNIEVRPLWKPMHLQPIFKNKLLLSGQVSDRLYQNGLCLPSGSGLTADQQLYVIDSIKSVVFRN